MDWICARKAEREGNNVAAHTQHSHAPDPTRCPHATPGKATLPVILAVDP